jgi:hypothetical protein
MYDRYWNSELSRWVYPTDDVDDPAFWERKYLEAAVELDALKMAVEDLSDWYLQKDACLPGGTTCTLGIANDLQSLLHNPDTFQCGVNDDNE